VDSQGTLWITAGNESVARVTRGQFHLVRERNAIPRWHPLHLVGEDREAVYLAAYEPAIFRVPRQGTVNAVQRIPLQPPPPLPFPAEVIQAGDGTLWYVTIQGSVGRVTVRPDGTHSQTNIDLGQPVQCLARDAAGQIWVAMSNRLGVLREHSFSDCTPSENPFARPIRRLVPTRRGGVWAWDGESLRRWRDGRWEAWARDFAPRSGAEEPRFFADSRDGLWVINYGFGLWHIEPDGAANVLTPRDGLPGVFITSWREDAEGNIWIGTREGGLARIRRARFHLYGPADGIPGEVAQSVCEDAQGVLWVGTATGGIARQEGERFVSVTLPALPGRTLESISVYPDRVEGIWIGTVKGSVLRYSQGQVTRPFPAQWLRDLMADVVMQDSSGRVWFANGSGAYYWADNQFTTFGRKFGFVEDLHWPKAHRARFGSARNRATFGSCAPAS
jgi:ligand-binding sensor domain-containing protein